MKYESEISFLEDGTIDLIIKGEEEQITDKYSKIQSIQERRNFPSEQELRRYLVREKFHTEALLIGGKVLETGGAILLATAVLSSFIEDGLLRETRDAQFVYGFALAYGASLINKPGRENKLRIDSAVHTFNQTVQTLPDVKPVRFSPRDYLATIARPAVQIPFLHR